MKKLLPLCIAAALSPLAHADELATLKARVAEQEARLNALADQLEQREGGNGGAWYNKMSFGGYGELHYNNLENQKNDSDKEQMDLHRFVLFTGYQFTDSVRFYSELEVEHTVAGDGANGEVELEQAFVEWTFAPGHRVRGGVMLLPVGMLNMTHEPNTFYGVERNNVENRILPTTWWEGGIGFNGELLAGLNYDVLVTEGMNLAIADAKFGVRDARQKTSEAKAEDLAYTVALNYTGIKGLLIGGSIRYQNDMSQDIDSVTYNADAEDEVTVSVEEIDALMYELHADWRIGDFNLRALYANWDISDDIEAINAAAAGADQQTGYYIEPSYMITEKLGVFVRYSEWDNQAGNSADSEYSQRDIGVNYYIVPTVVVKADLQQQDSPDGKDEFDGFNLGVGWSF